MDKRANNTQINLWIGLSPLTGKLITVVLRENKELEWNVVIILLNVST